MFVASSPSGTAITAFESGSAGRTTRKEHSFVSAFPASITFLVGRM